MIELDLGFHRSGTFWIQPYRREVFELLLQTVKSWGRRVHLEWHRFEQVRTYILIGFNQLITSQRTSVICNIVKVLLSLRHFENRLLTYY